MHKDKSYDAADFYNDIAGEYDEMFDFQKDLKAAQGLVNELKKQFKFETALDVGCGTGSFTIAMALAGIEATGMDLSASMVEAAKQNSLKYRLDVEFVNTGMMNMICKLEACKFDLIMCMGNTLPHLLNPDDLYSMLISCKQLLNSGGLLVLNLLNYDRILNDRERIVGISRKQNHEFIRFYDFEKPFVNFNIMDIDWSGQYPVHKLNTTRLYPYRLQELKSALHEADFRNIAVYEGLKFKKYDPHKSKSILITAIRS